MSKKRVEFPNKHWVEYDFSETGEVSSSLPSPDHVIANLLLLLEEKEKKYLDHPYFPEMACWGCP